MSRDHSIYFERAELKDLAAILDHVEGACQAAGISDSALYDIKLAVEEICANVIQHGYDDSVPGPLEVRVETGEGNIVVEIRDEAQPFDPDQVPTPDLTASLMERQVGGLGWYLSKQVMDELTQELVPSGGNRIRMVKHFSPPPMTSVRNVDMKISDSLRDGAMVVSVEGRVDSTTAERLMAALMAHVEGGQRRLVVDMALVDYIGSAGLRALLGPLEEIRARGGELILAAVKENVQRVLDVSRITTILKVYSDVEAALTSYT